MHLVPFQGSLGTIHLEISSNTNTHVHLTYSTTLAYMATPPTARPH